MSDKKTEYYYIFDDVSGFGVLCKLQNYRKFVLVNDNWEHLWGLLEEENQIKSSELIEILYEC